MREQSPEIDEQIAFYAAQIERLRPLRRFQENAVWHGEMLAALWKHSASEDHACRMIDYALDHGYGESGRECPTTADFRELASMVPVEIAAEQRVSADCPVCHGSGWETVGRKLTQGIFAGEWWESVRPCSECRKGVAA